jgi:integrase
MDMLGGAKPKGSAYLMQRPNGTIAMRVIVKSKKFECALFKWPLFDHNSRVILPNGSREYFRHLQYAMEMLERAKDILNSNKVGDIADFVRHWSKKESTLFGLMKEYISGLGLSATTKKIYAGRADALFKLLGDMPVSAVSIEHLRLIDRQFKDKSRSSAALCHAVMSGTLRLALERKEVSATPYDYFKCTVRNKPSKRAWVEADAVNTLFEAWKSEPDGRERKAMQLYLLQALTGARYSDAIRLRKSDFECGYFISQKTARKSSLYMSEKLKQVCPEEPISMGYTSYRMSLIAISERLGFDYSKSHAARRFFATKVFEHTGYNIKAVQDALGHSSIASTEKYILSDAHGLKDAVMKIGAF